MKHMDNHHTILTFMDQECKIAGGHAAPKPGEQTVRAEYFYMINAENNIMNKVGVSKMEVVSKIPVGKSAMHFGIKEGKEFPS